MAYCDRCDRFFSSSRALEQHENDSPRHNICSPCRRNNCKNSDFATWVGLKEHWVQSPRHSYCQECNSHFDNDDKLVEHKHHVHHWCRSCDRICKTKYGLKQHYANSGEHVYCSKCDRHFNGENDLQKHLHYSLAHGLQVSAVSFDLHETCAATGDNGHIDITTCEWARNSTNTKSHNSGMTSYATSLAFNGQHYECYICHWEFYTLPALNHHLSSPVHKRTAYVCPQATCSTRFKTLDALCRHVENGPTGCGVKRFKNLEVEVEGAVEELEDEEGLVARIGFLTLV